MQPLLSVIIPVYKTEDSLEKCVKSIQASEYKNLEILLIDDGSPDQCPQLCNQLAKEDKRIRVIHKENGGVSSAKNCGLDIATGEYVAFCDSDDTVPANAYRLLVEKAVESDADLVMGNICRRIVDSGETRETKKDLNNLSNLIGGHTGNIYRRLFLNKHSIRISPYKMGEAFLFMLKILDKTNNIQYIQDMTYNYDIRSSNAIHQSAVQMQFCKFELYYDDFVWRKEVIEYVYNSEKLKSRFQDQLKDFCKIIDEHWLYFEPKQRQECFGVLKETVALLLQSNPKINLKGYLKVKAIKIIKMKEKEYTQHIFLRYSIIEPVKRLIKH
ncbi:MAG: glycosyltransferase [Lachnospiraceae bacterium]|nr:glycosyltransferase [Lachnospiraceae bacterium]